MKIAIVSVWDTGYDELAAITMPNRKAYADKHGYDLVSVSGWTGGWEGRTPVWGRIDVARKIMHRYDAIFIMDVDAAITNLEVKLEDLATADFVATYDVNGFNSGMLLVKHTPWSVTFMDKYWDVGARYQHHVNSEQTCLSHLLIVEPKDKWEIKPQRTMNSFPYEEYHDFTFEEGNWQKGDFIIHIPALPLARRIEILQHKLGLSQNKD